MERSTMVLRPAKAFAGPGAKKISYLELASSKWQEFEQARVTQRLAIDTQEIQWAEAVRQANAENKKLFEKAVVARKIYYFIRNWKENTNQPPDPVRIPVTEGKVTNELVISSISGALDLLNSLG